VHWGRWHGRVAARRGGVGLGERGRGRRGGGE
jgi:hypothetical protein